MAGNFALSGEVKIGLNTSAYEAGLQKMKATTDSYVDAFLKSVRSATAVDKTGAPKNEPAKQAALLQVAQYKLTTGRQGVEREITGLQERGEITPREAGQIRSQVTNRIRALEKQLSEATLEALSKAGAPHITQKEIRDQTRGTATGAGVGGAPPRRPGGGRGTGTGGGDDDLTPAEHQREAEAAVRTLIADRQYIEATVALNEARHILSSKILEEERVTDKAVKAMVTLEVARQELSNALHHELSTHPDYLKARAGQDISALQTKAGISGQRVEDPRFDAAHTALAEAEAKEARQKAEAIAGNEKIQEERVRLGQLSAQEAASLARAKAGTDQSVKADAEKLNATRAYTKAVQQEAIDARNADLARQGTTPTRFQGLSARLRGATSGNAQDPFEQATLGQSVASRALIAGQYAIAGLSIRQTLQTVTSMVQEAEKLELVFAQVKLQMEAVGQGNQFDKARASILSMSKDLGLAADQLAVIYQRAFGVYQNLQQAGEATKAIGQLSVVTGLPGEEIFKSLEPAALAFDTTIGAIGDKVIGISQRMGVSVKETIAFFGRAAEVAATTGVSLEQLGAIAGTLQQRISIGGTAAADLFDRVATAAGQNMDKILELAGRIPALAPQMSELTKDFATGQTGPGLILIAQSWNQIGASAQSALLKLIANRREMATFKVLLDNLGPALQKEGAHIDDNGKLSLANAAAQDTLAQGIARLKEGLRQLGDSLARAGISDLLKDIANVAGIFGAAFGGLLKIFVAFNDATGHMVGRLAALALAIKAIQVALSFGGQLKTRILGPAAVVEAEGAADVAALTARQRFALGRQGGLGALRRGGGAAAAGEEGAVVGGAELGVAGTLGALAGPVLIAGSILAANAAYQGVKAKLATQGQKFYELAKKTLDEGNAQKQKVIDDLALGHQSLLERLAGAVGFDTPVKEAQKAEVASQTASSIASLTALKNVPGLGGNLGTETTRLGALGLFSKSRAVSLQSLIDRIGNGDAKAIVEAKTLLDSLKLDPKIKAQVDAAITVGKDTADQAAGAIIQTADEVVKGFKAGRKTTTEAFDAINAALLRNRNILAAQVAAGADTSKTLQEIDTLTGLAQDSVATVASWGDQQVSLIAALGGTSRDTERGITAEIGKIEAALAQADIGTEAAKGDVLKILQLKQAILKSQADHSQNAIAALKILAQGTTISPEDLANAGLLPENLLAGLAAPSTTATPPPFALGEIAGPPGPSRPTQPTPAFALPGFGVPSAPPVPTSGVKADQWGPGGATTPPVQGAPPAPPTAVSPWDLIPDGYTIDIFGMSFKWDAGRKAFTVGASAVDIVASQRQAIQDAQSKFTLKKSQTRDPVTQAGISLDAAKANLAGLKALTGDARATDAQLEAAQAQVNDAQNGLTDASVAVDAANRKLARARIGTLPNAIEDAKTAQADAKAAVANAHGDAATADALAQQIKADQGYKDALQIVADSRTNLLITMASAVGDDVKATRLRLDSDKAALARAVAQGGAGDEYLNQLKGTVATDAAAAIAAQVSNTQDIIDFQLEMNQITKGQAVAQLEAELPLVANNQKATRDLLRRIHSLMTSTSSDLQFNLGDLKLPTLYEVNRLGATGAAGGGYNDNRQVSIVMHNYNATDYQGSIDQFVDLVNQPSRVGTYSSIYPSRN
jgi:hypothetical protein